MGDNQPLPQPEFLESPGNHAADHDSPQALASKPPHSIAVCGAGTMGSGIALAFAQYGLPVMLYDLDDNILAKAKERIERKLPDGRVSYTTDITRCKADFIIEAVVELQQVKIKLFNELMSFNGDDTIFATNTSSLSVTAIAEHIARPAQFLGVHFFNPAPVMKLVEIVQTTFSTQSVVDKTTEMIMAIGKTPVVCKDAPGFIVNHVARPYYLEALYLKEHYDIEFSLIDELMESSGFRMGPFRLMDLIGNDINYSVSCVVHEALGKPSRLQPSTLQKEKVDSGFLGRKSGKGYYEYPNP